MDNKNNNSGAVGIIALAIIMGILLSMCSSDSGSSGRKWSDLSEVEKANARWAYEVQQGIKGR